jgi:hypothetical protein
MNKPTLQTVRRLVPGVLGFMTLSSLIESDYSPLHALHDLDAAVAAAGALTGAILLGVIYRGSGLQEVVHNFTWRTTTDDHLKARLFDLLEPGELDKEQRAKMSSGMAMIQLFYGIADNDNSLKNKVGDVYENGAYLGSAADLTLFAALGAGIHLALTFLSDRALAATWVVIFGILFVLAVAYILFGVRRHMGLTDDQFEYIRVNLAGVVTERLRRLAGSSSNN